MGPQSRHRRAVQSSPGPKTKVTRLPRLWRSCCEGRNGRTEERRRSDIGDDGEQPLAEGVPPLSRVSSLLYNRPSAMCGCGRGWGWGEDIAKVKLVLRLDVAVRLQRWRTGRVNEEGGHGRRGAE